MSPAPPLSCRMLGGSPWSDPPPPRLPNSAFSLRLKLRHISSRSGGPSLPPPRLPHCGSFNDIRIPAPPQTTSPPRQPLSFGRLALHFVRNWRGRRRCLRGCRLDQCPAQTIHAVARLCA